MLAVLLCAVLFAALMPFTASIVIDNEITSAQLICTDRDLQLHAVVKTPLFQEGRAFVKDHSRDPTCQHVYQRSTTDNAIMFRIPLGTCGMVRTAQSTNRFSFTITVVVSFHRLFITKVDRAYRLTCEYTKTAAPATKDYTVALAVSMLPTTFLPAQGVGGAGGECDNIKCTYKLYKGDFQQFGIRQEVRYARIGEKITHVWECSNLSPNQFIWVHDCIVNPEFSSHNDPVAIDARGCTLDPVIMSELEYQLPQNHMAIGHHHAYKFADYPNLLFKCSINICDRSSPTSCVYVDGRAVIVPPICTRLQSRYEREANLTQVDGSNGLMIEVLSDSLEVAQLSSEDTTDHNTEADSNIDSDRSEKRIVCISENVWRITIATCVFLFVAIFITALGVLKFSRFSEAKRITKLCHQ